MGSGVLSPSGKSVVGPSGVFSIVSLGKGLGTKPSFKTNVRPWCHLGAFYLQGGGVRLLGLGCCHLHELCDGVKGVTCLCSASPAAAGG